MKKDPRERKVVVVNHTATYLTIDMCNAFSKRFKEVGLITGAIKSGGRELHSKVTVDYINQWVARPAWKKSLSYLTAMLRIAWLVNTKYRSYEKFFISTPPMVYLLSLITPRPSSMLIWDVFPDGLKLIGMQESHPVYRSWAYLNKRSMRRAHRIFTIGESLADLLANYVSRDKVHITPIWSNFEIGSKIEKSENKFIRQEGLEGKFVVQYSGNIGLAHRVELMVELAEMLIDHKHIFFQIIGTGPRKPHLEKLVAEKNLENCQFLPFQPDDMFPYSLSASDLGVVILDAITSKRCIPSKTYNLMSFGIPILNLASSDSELYKYSEKYENGKCFEHGQLEEVAEFILELSRNPSLYERYANNSLMAANDFSRGNADTMVEMYIREPVKELAV